MVGAGQVTTAGVTKAPLPNKYEEKPDYDAPQSGMEDPIGDHRYESANNLKTVSKTLSIFVVFLAVVLLHDEFLKLAYSRNCARDEMGQSFKYVPESFKEVSRTHEATNTKMQFKRWSPVLITINYCKVCTPADNTSKHEYVSVVPYDSKTSMQDGVIGIMLHEISNVINKEVDPIDPGAILVAVDCMPIDDGPGGEESMSWDVESGWSGPGLADWLEDDKYAPKFTYAPPSRSLVMYKPQGTWCPSKDNSKLELVHNFKAAADGRANRNPCPTDHYFRKGPKVQNTDKIEVWLQDHKYSDEAEGPESATDELDPDQQYEGAHLHLGHGRDKFGFKPKGNDTIAYTFLFVLGLVVVYITYNFTQIPLQDPTADKQDQHFWRGLLDPSRGEEAQWPYSQEDLLKGMFRSVRDALLFLVFLRLAQTVLERSGAGKKIYTRNRRFMLYAGSLVTAISVCVCAFAPGQLFLFAKNMSSNVEIEFALVDLCIAWLNFFLVVVFFVNTLVKFMKLELGFKIEPMVNDDTGDLILAVAGVLDAVTGFSGTIRGYHGWDAGCEMSELGKTLRRIAADTLTAFPEGADLELHCTESTLSFGEVFNQTYRMTDEAGKNIGGQKLDDGNMCTLTCSLGGRVSATPIWCKNSGFFRARWTLSSHREDQAPLLCPTAANAKDVYHVRHMDMAAQDVPSAHDAQDLDQGKADPSKPLIALS